VHLQLTHIYYPPEFFSFALGVHVHPVHLLATPMHSILLSTNLFIALS